MSALRIRGIPQNITKDRLFELYPGCGISLSRAESSATKTSQTATVTFQSEITAKDILRNKPLRIDGQAVIVDDKFDGLTVLYLGSEARVDIIAVHGMGGHAFRSWTFGENNAMWLRDFLPTDIPEARIMTYGYNSDFMDSNSVAGIRDFGSRLLTVIDDKRTEAEKERPIIFICHSLGGIVVKQALIMARKQPQLRTISQTTTGIVFLATPHNGSQSANYRYIIHLIATIQGLNRGLIQDLEKNSDTLMAIANEFSEHHSSIIFASFYETRKSNFGFWLGTKLAVDQLSSILNAPHETRDGLDKDHMEISKFEHSEDGGYLSVVKRIQGMAKRAIESAQGPLESKLDPDHFLVPYSRNPSFSSREDILGELSSKVVWTTHQRVALYGLGGIGKTQIAIEYAYRFQHLERPPGVKPASIFWVHGSSYERFLQDYRGISKAAKLPESGDIDDVLLKSTKNWLQSPASGNWVLIVDNADDLNQYFLTTTDSSHDETPEERKLSNFIPQGSKGMVIVTTRDRHIAERITEDKALQIHVASMTQEEATSLFLAKSGKIDIPEEKEVLGKLLSELDYLPLAVAQAAAYISSVDDMTISHYFEMFNKHRIELLCEEFSDLRRDPTSKSAVLKTWLISFQQIQIQSPLAVNLLRLIAFLDRQAIPKKLLKLSRLEGVDNDKMFIDALRKLMAFSLITSSSKETYEVHRLVHLATYESLSRYERKEWKAKALNLLARVFPDDEVGSWRTCEAYRAHALAVIKHWPQGLEALDNEDVDEAGDTQKLFENLGMFLRYKGQLPSAEEYLRRNLEISLKDQGPEHPNTLASFSNLSMILKDQGKLSKAEEMCRRSLDGSVKILGPEHPDTLTSFNELSLILKDQGKLGEAEEMCRRSLDGRVKILGPEHRITLISFSNLSMIIQDQGKPSKAEEMCRRALDGRVKILGPEHPSTLTSFSNLSVILQDQGKPSKAEEMCRRSLDGRVKILGPEHPDTLTSFSNLSMILQDQGKPSKAEEMCRRSLDGSVKILGPEHPSTLIRFNKLSVILQDQGKLGEAEEMYRRALDGRVKILGPEHPSTLTGFNDLSLILKDQGKLGEAEEMSQRALNGYLKILGPEHPFTLTSFCNLSMILKDQGKLGEAEEMCRRSLDRSVKILGPEHPDTLISFSNLGLILKNQGKLSGAEEMCRRSLDGSVKILGPEHPSTLRSSNNLSSILRDQENLSKANELKLPPMRRKRSYDSMVDLQRNGCE